MRVSTGRGTSTRHARRSWLVDVVTSLRSPVALLTSRAFPAHAASFERTARVPPSPTLAVTLLAANSSSNPAS